MPRGGELSSFKVPGVGNLLHSCKKNTNPGGIARGGGMVTAGIDPCISNIVQGYKMLHFAFFICIFILIPLTKG
jgi:hypothetical protein